MNIYSSTKSAPYVYVCVHKVTQHFYIGYRESNILPSSEDFPIYRTSSLPVKTNFEEFNWQIIAEFSNGQDAYDFEQSLIFENWGNPLLMNKHCYHTKHRFRRESSPWNKGKSYSLGSNGPMSNDTKDKISKKAKGRILGKQSEEHKNKRLTALRGKSWEEIYGKERADQIRAQRKLTGRKSIKDKPAALV